jgi:hypothetical protein
MTGYFRLIFLSVKICNLTLKMKFAIFLILIFSSQCDLEAQEQPTPLVAESQKNDILIPTAGREPIKVSFSNNVKSVNVDGHLIQTPASAPRLHRKLNLARRNSIRYRRTSSDEVVEPNESGPSDEGTDIIQPESTDESNSEPVEQEKESYSYEPESGDESEEYEEEGESGSECPELLSDENYQYALESTFSSDSSILSSEIDETENMISNLDSLYQDENYTLDLGTLKIAIGLLGDLFNFKSYFQCDQGAIQENSESEEAENEPAPEEYTEPENAPVIEDETETEETISVGGARRHRNRKAIISRLNAMHKANRTMHSKVAHFVHHFTSKIRRNHLVKRPTMGVPLRRHLRTVIPHRPTGHSDNRNQSLHMKPHFVVRRTPARPRFGLQNRFSHIARPHQVLVRGHNRFV